MSEPRWLPRLAVEAMHLDQLRQHGGATGLRDEGLLESALARPRQRWAYEPDAGLPVMAATYASGILRNHPFVDGNKRTAFLAMTVFLAMNGLDFQAEEAEVVRVILDAAAGDLDEEGLADWIEASCRPLP